MTIGIVYTGMTSELVQDVEGELRKQLGESCILQSYSDPAILTEVRRYGYVTAKAAARLIGMYATAIEDGAEAILNVCSSVGEIADSMQGFAAYIGIPIVRIDEKMCLEAVKSAKKIAVMATLSTTLEPTKNTILRLARKCGKQVSVSEILVENVFDGDAELLRQEVCEAALKKAENCDVILLAQGSMGYCEEELRRLTGKEIFSSPRYGAVALKEALQERRELK